MRNSVPQIVIIGSGIGGATIAAALAPTGAKITILERGESIPDDEFARDDNSIFKQGHYLPNETWLDANGKSFVPGNYYCVGGNSKFYGAVLMRFRAEDFDELSHLEGTSPSWPIAYEDLEPFYQQAELLFNVRGDAAIDPSEPAHSGDYGFTPIANEPTIEKLRQRLLKAGVTPSPLPLGVDVTKWLERGQNTWDAYPDTVGAKSDAQSVGLRHALEHKNVRLVEGAAVARINTNRQNIVTSVQYDQHGERHEISADLCILSAGAVNSAALLLGSANDRNPNGLANSSDQVGRNFMNHNCSAVLAMHPFEPNSSVYQKTLQFNDFYFSSEEHDYPLGNVQLLGKITANMLQSQSPIPAAIARYIARHSIGFYAMSEDLPNAENRVTFENGQIRLSWARSNWKAHNSLVKKTKRTLHKAGYPIQISQPFSKTTVSHQCGTIRFGVNPSKSPLDKFCRTFDHENLFVVDASFFPSSAAVNPALTIAAQALRTAEHIIEKDIKLS